MIEKIRSLPQNAGVYQYLDKNNRILYIGKAKNLSKRVKSYFNITPTLKPKDTLSMRIQKMLSECVDIDYIVASNEHDALILENSLIKQLKPKYNILLRDDKTYPYIYINLDENYPRFEITRKVITGKNIHYFGPFSSGAREILDSIYELLPLVQKKSCLKGNKSCLFYQINRCLAPCEFDIDKNYYNSMVDTAISWIKNKKLLAKELESKMNIYAEELRFEEAMILRDRIEKISRGESTSSIDLATNENYDIFAIADDDKYYAIVKQFIRDGKLISSTHNIYPKKESFSLDESYERAILSLYNTTKPPIIAPILVADEFESMEWISQHLSSLFEKKATIINPKKGTKKELLQLAIENAKELLRTQSPKQNTILEKIQELFMLQNTPCRIEIFDNSHLSGIATVGAMVVYDNNKFDKDSKRLYHLHHGDEYSQMRELLIRRIENFIDNPPPDLWVIDGGETLRNLAKELLQSHGITLDVIAISKEKVDAKSYRAKGATKDIIYSDSDIFRLAPSDKRLQFIQMLRDEAHKSAITFHRKTKQKIDKESKLLNVRGISEAKVKKLLDYFGTFDEIYKSDFKTLSVIIGEKCANEVKKLSFDEDYK